MGNRNNLGYGVGLIGMGNTGGSTSNQRKQNKTRGKASIKASLKNRSEGAAQRGFHDRHSEATKARK